MEKDHLEILLEDIRGKFDLVLEGHSVLNKRIDDLDHKLDDRFDLMCLKLQAVHERLDEKIGGVEARLSEKIDAVAADLSAHRADTEGHKTGYRVSESRD